MTDTITIKLSEAELDTLQDCVRWTKEHCEEKGLRRVKNQTARLQNTINEQVDDG